MRLSDLRAADKTITATIRGQEVSITYRPDFYTTAVEATLSEAEQGGRPLALLAEVVAGAIIAWDLTDDKDKPLPITKDVIGSLGVTLAGEYLQAIVSDAVPNQPTSSS